MITYLCPQCGMDFAVTELDKAKCFYCQASDIEFIQKKKQKLTPKVIKERLKITTNRMMENLQKAYVAGKESGCDEDTDELIDVLAQAKELQQEITDLKLKV